MTTTQLSNTRELWVHNREDGTVGYIGMAIDGVQIAAGARQSDDHKKSTGYDWHIWTSLLTLDDASPLAARDEKSVRRWLELFADMYEGKVQK